MTDKKGPDHSNFDEHDHKLYDEGGTQGPFSHITSAPPSRTVTSGAEPTVEPDLHSIIRWHGEGGRPRDDDD